jgi:hypothetical protein
VITDGLPSCCRREDLQHLFKSLFSREAPNVSLEGRDAHFIGGDQARCLHLFVVFAPLVFLDPNTKQMRADLMRVGNTVDADLTG